ncbi:hypothetical protein PC118_g21903 [Phytophthora cactorum]|uniref:Uncharacterized protein n=1 Tax=Phytophthora cactorum TaxID=29920 RepID=A0A8T1C4H3_9STRA|nr:hypothetical protein PC112_g21939 [Phytophthora cactorum]KAG2914827.1 hypothetical protein PC117_g18207 [Phytophthora cactorum]KAG2961566.1 hypothetical protein PC118_g21903 [Phytophthora cactorum]KAG3054750.1 hypothetical protein PC122_g21926 [Phytophthora cactorum]KAG3142430.1 hypothetical protein C6341_g19434 [Phytophthora cactorum]
MLTTFGEQRGWEPIGRGTQLAAKDPEYVSLQPAFYTAREMHFVVISLRNRLRIGSRAGKAARVTTMEISMHLSSSSGFQT